MDTILIAPREHAPAKGRILAIEPDPARAEALRDLIGDHVGAECALVKDSNDAIRSIEAQIPDLVLTSMLLAPRDAAALTACLQRLPAAAHVQVITVPFFIDSEAATRPRPSKILRFNKRRAAMEPPTCAPAVVGAQIEAYLDQARADRKERAARSGQARSGREDRAARSGQARSGRTQPWARGPGSSVRLDAFAPAYGSAMRSDAAGAARPRAKVHQLGRPYANDRRRARRRAAADLPWLWTIKLPSGLDLRVVDVSSQGALLETSTMIAPGTALDLRMIGEDLNVSVPARTIRTEVATVDARGVRYRIAASFVSSMEIRGLEAPPPAGSVHR